MEWIPVIIVLIMLSVLIVFFSANLTTAAILIVLMLIGFGIVDLMIGQYYQEHRPKKSAKSIPSAEPLLSPEDQIDRAVTNALNSGVDPVDIKRVVVQAIKKQE